MIIMLKLILIEVDKFSIFLGLALKELGKSKIAIIEDDNSKYYLYLLKEDKIWFMP